MAKSLSVLLVGESCFATSTEYKGIDHFSETNYYSSGDLFGRIIEGLGHQFTHIPCHLISRLYPRNLEELQQFDVVLFSDVGSNSFLLLPEVVRQGKRSVNLLKLTCEYVKAGGGFGMIGGYMTFQGMDARGKWKETPIEEILPVTLRDGDDRREIPEGADLICEPGSHPILSGLPAQWPYILGYNRLTAKSNADVVVAFENDPIIALCVHGEGRVLAYATDCAPHWAPASMHEWEHYPKLWDNILHWLAKHM